MSLNCWARDVSGTPLISSGPSGPRAWAVGARGSATGSGCGSRAVGPKESQLFETVGDRCAGWQGEREHEAGVCLEVRRHLRTLDHTAAKPAESGPGQRGRRDADDLNHVLGDD